MSRKERDSAQRKRDRARLKAIRANCHICGDPIDYTLAWPDPMCFVADHVIAFSKDGADNMTNKKSAHNTCNSTKRARNFAPIVRRSGSLD